MDKKEEGYHELVGKLVEKGIDLTYSKAISKKAGIKQIQDIRKVPILEQEINRLKRGIWFENNTLYVRAIDGTTKSLQVDTRRGNKKMYDFLMICLINLKENPEADKDWVKTSMMIDKIKTMLSKRGVWDVDMNWIKNTRSNLNQKIESAGLQNYVSISTFDRKQKCYIFRVNSICLRT